MDYAALSAAQRTYYLSGATRSLAARQEALQKLFKAIKAYEKPLADAVKVDLNRPAYETYMCETGVVLDEIRYIRRRLPRWVKEKRVSTSIKQIFGRGYICPEPRGVVLIISPWNYPVQLCLLPLVAALAAGNCAVIKPSVKAAATGAVLQEMLSGVFPPEQVSVVLGSHEETAPLLEQRWDYVFFTGSAAAGREILRKSAEHLTPVLLELSGKSPVIIDPTADLALAAKRIAFGKILNAGQTCVAPDYVLIHESVRDRFVEEYRKALGSFFPKNDMSSMAHIITPEHFRRVAGLLEGENAAIGGGTDEQTLFIEPTVLIDVRADAPIMQEEIFGPVLPLLTWTDIVECLDFVRSRPTPLALYLFSKDKTLQRRVLDSCSFGGGCINDTMLHVNSPKMPFGGVNESGMGRYHGRAGFDTFTNYRSMLCKNGRTDTSVRYRPYNKMKSVLLHRLVR